MPKVKKVEQVIDADNNVVTEPVPVKKRPGRPSK